MSQKPCGSLKYSVSHLKSRMLLTPRSIK